MIVSGESESLERCYYEHIVESLGYRANRGEVSYVKGLADEAIRILAIPPFNGSEEVISDLTGARDEYIEVAKFYNARGSLDKGE